MITYPAELEANLVLPAIRKEICIAAIASGLKQKDIARILGITEAAASQYLRGKRASEVKFDTKFKTKVREIVKKVILGEIGGFSAVQMLAFEFKISGGLCRLHDTAGGIGPETCGLGEVCLK